MVERAQSTSLPGGWNVTFRSGNSWPHWRPLGHGYMMCLHRLRTLLGVLGLYLKVREANIKDAFSRNSFSGREVSLRYQDTNLESHLKEVQFLN